MMPGPLPPAAVYLDTSLVVAAVIDSHVHHAASIAFCTRLIDARSHVRFSIILRLEFAQVLVKLAKDPQRPAALRRGYRLDRWDARESVRERWLTFGFSRFDALMARFDAVSEVAFDLPIWEASLDVMARHRLRSHDAIHVATARAGGVRDLATLDDDFRRVPDLRVWLIRDAAP